MGPTADEMFILLVLLHKKWAQVFGTVVYLVRRRYLVYLFRVSCNRKFSVIEILFYGLDSSKIVPQRRKGRPASIFCFCRMMFRPQQRDKISEMLN